MRVRSTRLFILSFSSVSSNALRISSEEEDVVFPSFVFFLSFLNPKNPKQFAKKKEFFEGRDNRVKKKTFGSRRIQEEDLKKKKKKKRWRTA